MTTLVGVVARKGNSIRQGVVIASDITSTLTGWKSDGEVAIKEQTKSEHQKMYVDDARRLTVAMTGVYDFPYCNFLKKLLSGKIDFRKAVKKKQFDQFFKLNLGRFEGMLWDNEHQNSLLVATRYAGKPELWSCWPLGKVCEIPLATSIGSGSKHAFDYFKSKDILGPNGLSLPEAITFAVEAMERASTDIYTGGLDVVVVTHKGIDEYGSMIAQTLKDAKRKAISDVINRYRAKS